MPLYTSVHTLLNVLVQIANKMGLQKKKKLSSDTTRTAQKTTGPTILLPLRVYVSAVKFIPNCCLVTLEVGIQRLLTVVCGARR
jgi:hypothetical protein